MDGGDGHGHGGHGHGHGHSHDHGHDCVAEHKELQEHHEERWLYDCIDTANIRALNADPAHNALGAIKPYDKRRDTDTWLESDADEQLIITIPFTGTVRLKSFSLGSGAGEQGPLKVKFLVRDDVDFDNVEDLPVTQEFELPRDNPVDAEHPVRVAKFNRVRALTVFVDTNHGGDTTRINYFALKGIFSHLKTEPVVAEYEIKPMPGDVRNRLETMGGAMGM
uniref:PITH domain-containing protein n=1 Tax=Hemiselmis andersenii TaxID=464988 RepID=A0A6U4IEM0_HEMAN|mmetsp:Transcript_8059/g.18770  ORF Transcript_8059/g.18770 Transcript_8059/m.18770 type:complete len:222 (+) Transcript_8059:214-879(+)|eukprot:CAMPEP_0114132966 /NCGR_PEP_ID=MMETSP0043_2-20121206/13376_1 /TAXON_ID=464988 /ORGANISM="Hemiselmis andersenii, Strain CCMP644" /LENGTH=221 /DNA_ID=CAMNT_0001226515 /DNA_START=184 /DNA_END=849 /DNA_ORIENTATION=-